MTSPTTIPGLFAEPDALDAPRWAPQRAVARLRAAEAERGARACLSMFLVAALGRDDARGRSLAAALFACGAIDASTRRAGLSGRARARLERALLRALTGSSRRALSAWRRTLDELGSTPHGRLLRRGGEDAFHAWLHGEAPGPRLTRLLDVRPLA